MKKSEIVKVITGAQERAQINHFTTLVHVTKDALGVPCDHLYVDFNQPAGIGKFTCMRDIDSRDYVGVMDEVKSYLNDLMNEIRDYLISAIDNGYTV